MATSRSSADPPYRNVLLLRGRLLKNTLRTMPRTAELPELVLLDIWGRALRGKSMSDGERSDRGEDAMEPSSDCIRRAASENERPRVARGVTCGGVASCSAIVGGGPSSGSELSGELDPIDDRWELGSSKRRVTMSRLAGMGMGWSFRSLWEVEVPISDDMVSISKDGGFGVHSRAGQNSCWSMVGSDDRDDPAEWGGLETSGADRLMSMGEDALTPKLRRD